MSKRVYEIARELNLESKEVIGRLNDAGVQVKSHSSSVDEPDYERVFGAAANGDVAPNWRTVAQEEEVQEAREEAEHAGHNATIAAAPSEEPASEPKQDRPLKKRRRVVIDASARNRGARTSVPAPHREPERESSETEAKSHDSDAVQVEPGATVKDLGEAIGVPPTQIIKILMGLGEMKTLTQTLSTEEIELISEELGIEVEIGAVEDLAPAEMAPNDAPEELVEKPPVVTVMGHVDHGKTSLLDRIRQANVQSGEAGGITQHIGAYQVAVGDGGKRISFIDTPGHEAFTEMRARGAKVTDIVVLVVAADDGIMPQTLEAIEHARAAGVPLVVAVNKIDVPNANQDRVFGELSERGLVPEVYGGDTITVPVSAKTGEGIDELLENILVVAELEDLKANPKAPASGYVIEGERDPGRGPVATLLLSRGTLNKGDAVLAGTAYGRVRAMLDYTGKRVKDAGPGTPVEILGLSGVPEAGTRFEVLDHERLARDRAQQAEAASRRQALAKLSTEEVRVNIVRSGVGALTDSDVMLASASDGILLGFNVRPTSTAKQVSERENVEIRTYDVIYKALEDIEAAMRGMLAPEIEERESGTAEVRQTFRVPNVGVVAGCYVTSGEIFRNNRVRVVRDGTVVYEGNIASLKRFRDDVRSVREGFECGLGVENFNDVTT